MEYTKEELEQFPDLDEVEKEIFTEEQVQRIHKKAVQRSLYRRKRAEIKVDKNNDVTALSSPPRSK
jgi:isocitrate/isopropylmalate dehydrogenase